MRLCSIVHYCVNIVVLESSKGLLRVRDVTLDELEVWLIIESCSVVSRRAVVKFVVRDDVVLWVLEREVSDDVGRDETSTSSDEDVLGVLTNL